MVCWNAGSAAALAPSAVAVPQIPVDATGAPPPAITAVGTAVVIAADPAVAAAVEAVLPAAAAAGAPMKPAATTCGKVYSSRYHDNLEYVALNDLLGDLHDSLELLLDSFLSLLQRI